MSAQMYSVCQLNQDTKVKEQIAFHFPRLHAEYMAIFSSPFNTHACEQGIMNTKPESVKYGL